MEDGLKNILIIGHSAKESAIAQVLSDRFNVYIAPGNDSMKQFGEIVDIREDNVIELLNFALEHDIYFTIVGSEIAIKHDVAGFFNSNDMMIFSPDSISAQFTLSRAAAKKMFYKLRLPTPRFAVYEKKNLAIDYVKKSDMPIIIKTDSSKQNNSVMVCPSFNIAKSYIEDLYQSGESKVIIEEFVYGTNFSFYVITDGFKALPIGSTRDYKFSLEGDGGIWTDGMGATSPFSRLTYDLEDYIMNDVVYPIINYLADNLTPYLGIIGFDGVLTPNGDVAILECRPFLQDHDAHSILSLIKSDVFSLMHACSVGSFSDDYDVVDFTDDYAQSCVISSGKSVGKVIEGLDELDESTYVDHISTRQNEYTEFETLGERTLVLTTKAKTLSRSISKLSDEIKLIKFDGKNYRRDLINTGTKE